MQLTRSKLRKLISEAGITGKKTELNIELARLNKDIVNLFDKIVIETNPIKLAEPYATGIKLKGTYGNKSEEELLKDLASEIGKSTDRNNLHSFLLKLNRLVPESHDVWFEKDEQEAEDLTESLSKLPTYQKYSYGIDDIPEKTKGHKDIIGHT